MDKCCYCDTEYKIIHNNRDYTLVNLKGNYENHGHFCKESSCHLLIRLMRKQIVPKSRYLQNAVLRISTDEKYKQKVLNKQEKLKNKQQYMNVNNGFR
jgi:hypothetical protein